MRDKGHSHRSAVPDVEKTHIIPTQQSTMMQYTTKNSHHSLLYISVKVPSHQGLFKKSNLPSLRPFLVYFTFYFNTSNSKVTWAQVTLLKYASIMTFSALKVKGSLTLVTSYHSIQTHVSYSPLFLNPDGLQFTPKASKTKLSAENFFNLHFEACFYLCLWQHHPSLFSNACPI